MVGVRRREKKRLEELFTTFLCKKTNKKALPASDKRGEKRLEEVRENFIEENPGGTSSTEKNYQAPYARVSSFEDPSTRNSEYAKAPQVKVNFGTSSDAEKAYVYDFNNLKLEKIPEVPGPNSIGIIAISHGCTGVASRACGLVRLEPTRVSPRLPIFFYQPKALNIVLISRNLCVTIDIKHTSIILLWELNK
ncbi:hypothetical protein Tco_0374940 [Tanacetum coccineum]